MNIFILRHGIAVERDDLDFKNDAARPLTTEGERQLRKVSAAMKKMELRFDLILSSPFERAKRTAEIVAEEMNLKKRLVFLAELRSDGSAKKLVRALCRQGAENVLLIGHEPYLSCLISVLTTGKTKMDIDLRKAGLCKLQSDNLEYGRCASLVWLLTPKQMEMMA